MSIDTRFVHTAALLRLRKVVYEHTLITQYKCVHGHMLHGLADVCVRACVGGASYETTELLWGRSCVAHAHHLTAWSGDPVSLIVAAEWLQSSEQKIHTHTHL